MARMMTINEEEADGYRELVSSMKKEEIRKQCQVVRYRNYMFQNNKARLSQSSSPRFFFLLTVAHSWQSLAITRSSKWGSRS